MMAPRFLILQSRYRGMKMIRSIEPTKTARGRVNSVIWGYKVISRPVRSPVFQNRNAKGMKEGGLSHRGAESTGRTLKISWVKTGKTIVMLKTRKTAIASHFSFRKSVVIPTTLRPPCSFSSASSTPSMLCFNRLSCLCR